MSGLLQKLRTGLRQRAEYNRTVFALRQMSIDTALDLDIYHGDIPSIARRAVYGR